MNRTTVVISSVVALLVVGAFLALFWSQDTGPTTSTQQPGSSTQQQGGQSTVSVSNDTAKAAVRSAYQQLLDRYDQDNTKLYETAVSGSYALQVWAGNIMGGEALMRYDSAKRQWDLIDAGGGQWSVQTLVGAGVPEVTAEDLVSQINQ